MKLAEKVAVITGAGSGIGRAIAREFSREGARVIVSDIQEKWGAETVSLIERDGLEATFVLADSSRERDIDFLVDKTLEKYGRIDILVNNAGRGGSLEPITELSLEEWDGTIAVNLRGPFVLTKRVVPEMLKNGRGNVINIASMASFAAGRGGLAYTVSKHGLLGFTRQLSFMLGPSGIRVNAICPGPIDTPMIRRILDEPQHPVCRKIKASPAGKVGAPEDVAKVALFLASDDSSFIHGAAYAVDGGYTIF